MKEKGRANQIMATLKLVTDFVVWLAGDWSLKSFKQSLLACLKLMWDSEDLEDLQKFGKRQTNAEAPNGFSLPIYAAEKNRILKKHCLGRND